MFARGKMNHAIHVSRPANRFGIHRSGYDKSAVQREAGGLEKKRFEAGLSVLTIGAKIAEIEPGFPADGKIRLRIDRAVKGASHAGAPGPFNLTEERSAGE